MLLGEKVVPYEEVREATRYLGSVFRTYIGNAEFILRDVNAVVRVDNMDYVMQHRLETDTYVAVLGNRKYTIASSVIGMVVFSVREEEYELSKRKQQVLLLC